MNKAVIGNNSGYSSAARTSVSEPRGAMKREREREGLERKIEIDIALKNQYRYEPESQSSLTFVFIVNFRSICYGDL